MTKTIYNKVLSVVLTVVLATTFASCAYFSQGKLSSEVNNISKDLPKDLDNGMAADEISYEKNRNMVSIRYVWTPSDGDAEWFAYYATTAERKEKVLNLVSIKKISYKLAELIEAAEAGIEIEVVAGDASVATITYPNLSTFNDAAKGRATDVNE